MWSSLLSAKIPEKEAIYGIYDAVAGPVVLFKSKESRVTWEIAIPGAAVVDGGSATDSRNSPGDERGMKTAPETLEETNSFINQLPTNFLAFLFTALISLLLLLLLLMLILSLMLLLMSSVSVVSPRLTRLILQLFVQIWF